MGALRSRFTVLECLTIALLTAGCGDEDEIRNGAGPIGDLALDPEPGDGASEPPPGEAVPPIAEAPAGDLPLAVQDDPSTVAPSADTPVVDAAAAATLCAALAEDRSAQNLRAINRLGLEMSSLRVEGTLGAPVLDTYGNYRAPFEIETVWVGPTFLEGTRTSIGLTPGEVAGLALPGRYIVGAGSTLFASGSPYPVRGAARELSSLDKEVIIPSAEREQLTDLLDYGIQGEPLVAVVQVVAQDAESSRLGVVEALAGDLPRSITVSWSTSSYDASFPTVSVRNYLATFGSVSFNESLGTNLGQLVDFRPYDASALELVQRALAAPRPARDVSSLLSVADEYRLAWAVHRSQWVAATRISGLAHECCSSAGGTYIAHDVLEDLRGDATLDRLILGGHDYFSDERCGDAVVVAVDAFEAARVTASAPEFACGEPRDWPSSDWVNGPRVNARLVDSEATRVKVRGWVRSPEPRHLLRREADARAPFDLGPDAVWSRPMPADQAVVIAPLSWINVVGRSESSGRLVVETGFSSSPAGSDTRQRFELDAECNDALAALRGEWLVPLVTDDPVEAAYSGTESDAFIVPGVVFPNYGYIARIADKLRFAIGADEVLHAVP